MRELHLSFCSLHESAHQSEFPASHYYGITVTIDFSAVTEEMERVLELLILTGLDLPEDYAKHASFPAAQIETVKQVHALLVEHFSEHYTIGELSARFDLSPTVLKKGFRGVYGPPVYAYMKKYRLQVAERLLKESRAAVGEIALRVGYQNPNKFTSAFCAEYSIPPTSYRKEV